MLLYTFMHVLVTFNDEVDPVKNESARVASTFSHYKSMEIFETLKGS